MACASMIRRAGTNRHPVASRLNPRLIDAMHAWFSHAPLWLFSRRRSCWQFDGAARRTTLVLDFGIVDDSMSATRKQIANHLLGFATQGLSSAGQDDGGDGRGWRVKWTTTSEPVSADLKVAFRPFARLSRWNRLPLEAR